MLKSRQLLSLRLRVWHSHTRTCVWTPWSVFQDGSCDSLQAITTRRSVKTLTPWQGRVCLQTNHLLPAHMPKERSRPHLAVPKRSVPPNATRRQRIKGRFTAREPVLADARRCDRTSDSICPKASVTAAQPISWTSAGFTRLPHSGFRHV